VVIVMTDRVRLIVIRVLLAVLIVIRVLLAATVTIVLAGSIVMHLVEHLVVIATTDHVRLIVTLVSRVMIVLAGLIAIHVLHVLQHKNARMKLRVALANVAQVAKCHCHQNVLVKIG
jgi:hypothetical protein